MHHCGNLLHFGNTVASEINTVITNACNQHKRSHSVPGFEEHKRIDGSRARVALSKSLVRSETPKWPRKLRPRLITLQIVCMLNGFRVCFVPAIGIATHASERKRFH